MVYRLLYWKNTEILPHSSSHPALHHRFHTTHLSAAQNTIVCLKVLWLRRKKVFHETSLNTSDDDSSELPAYDSPLWWCQRYDNTSIEKNVFHSCVNDGTNCRNNSSAAIHLAACLYPLLTASVLNVSSSSYCHLFHFATRNKTWWWKNLNKKETNADLVFSEKICL